MIPCRDPTWWSSSRCYSDAEGNESSTDHQLLSFTAIIFQRTHTWKHNCGLLRGYQYFAECASVIRHGTDTMAQRDSLLHQKYTPMLKYKVVNPQLQSHWNITGTFSHFKIVNIHQLLNTVIIPNISLLCLLASPLLWMSGYETHVHAKHASVLLPL